MFAVYSRVAAVSSNALSSQKRRNIKINDSHREGREDQVQKARDFLIALMHNLSLVKFSSTWGKSLTLWQFFGKHLNFL
jgi:hypothetical protein